MPGPFDYFKDLSNDSGLYSSGYWLHPEDTLKKAQTNLIEKVASCLHPFGNTLDVACGTGATLKYLSTLYAPNSLYGIDIDETRIAMCRQLMPGCKLAVMNASKLEFADTCFNNLICIGSAVYFNTRQRFLAEAHRVLAADGRLVMYDVIEKIPNATDRDYPVISDMEGYRRCLRAVGFKDICVADISAHVFEPFKKFLAEFAENNATEANHIEISEYQAQTLEFMSQWKWYVWVTAAK